MAAATYSRWEHRAQTGALTDRVVTPRRYALPPTPAEVDAVCAFALRHPTMGYKRLAWWMLDEEGACLRPSQVYYRAVDALVRWSHYYNYQRPHSALDYMPPIEYYRGDPSARWDARRRKLAHAARARTAYWKTVGQGRVDLSQN